MKSDSLSVQGTDDIRLPEPVRRWFEGKGIPMEFLKEHYGLGRSLSIGQSRRLQKEKADG